VVGGRQAFSDGGGALLVAGVQGDGMAVTGEQFGRHQPEAVGGSGYQYLGHLLS
jgi:hypothetical protein